MATGAQRLQNTSYVSQLANNTSNKEDIIKSALKEFVNKTPGEQESFIQELCNTRKPKKSQLILAQLIKMFLESRGQNNTNLTDFLENMPDDIRQAFENCQKDSWGSRHTNVSGRGWLLSSNSYNISGLWFFLQNLIHSKTITSHESENDERKSGEEYKSTISTNNITDPTSNANDVVTAAVQYLGKSGNEGKQEIIKQIFEFITNSLMPNPTTGKIDTRLLLHFQQKYQELRKEKTSLNILDARLTEFANQFILENLEVTFKDSNSTKSKGHGLLSNSYNHDELNKLYNQQVAKFNEINKSIQNKINGITNEIHAEIEKIKTISAQQVAFTDEMTIDEMKKTITNQQGIITQLEHHHNQILELNANLEKLSHYKIRNQSNLYDIEYLTNINKSIIKNCENTLQKARDNLANMEIYTLNRELQDELNNFDSLCRESGILRLDNNNNDGISLKYNSNLAPDISSNDWKVILAENQNTLAQSNILLNQLGQKSQTIIELHNKVQQHNDNNIAYPVNALARIPSIIEQLDSQVKALEEVINQQKNLLANAQKKDLASFLKRTTENQKIGDLREKVKQIKEHSEALNNELTSLRTRIATSPNEITQNIEALNELEEKQREKYQLVDTLSQNLASEGLQIPEFGIKDYQESLEKIRNELNKQKEEKISEIKQQINTIYKTFPTMAREKAPTFTPGMNIPQMDKVITSCQDSFNNLNNTYQLIMDLNQQLESLGAKTEDVSRYDKAISDKQNELAKLNAERDSKLLTLKTEIGKVTQDIKNKSQEIEEKFNSFCTFTTNILDNTNQIKEKVSDVTNGLQHNKSVIGKIAQLWTNLNKLQSSQQTLRQHLGSETTTDEQEKNSTEINSRLNMLSLTLSTQQDLLATLQEISGYKSTIEATTNQDVLDVLAETIINSKTIPDNIKYELIGEILTKITNPSNMRFIVKSILNSDSDEMKQILFDMALEKITNQSHLVELIRFVLDEITTIRLEIKRDLITKIVAKIDQGMLNEASIIILNSIKITDDQKKQVFNEKILPRITGDDLIVQLTINICNNGIFPQIKQSLLPNILSKASFDYLNSTALIIISTAQISDIIKINILYAIYDVLYAATTNITLTGFANWINNNHMYFQDNLASFQDIINDLINEQKLQEAIKNPAQIGSLSNELFDRFRNQLLLALVHDSSNEPLKQALNARLNVNDSYALGIMELILIGNPEISDELLNSNTDLKKEVVSLYLNQKSLTYIPTDNNHKRFFEWTIELLQNEFFDIFNNIVHSNARFQIQLMLKVFKNNQLVTSLSNEPKFLYCVGSILTEHIIMEATLRRCENENITNATSIDQIEKRIYQQFKSDYDTLYALINESFRTNSPLLGLIPAITQQKIGAIKQEQLTTNQLTIIINMLECINNTQIPDAVSTSIAGWLNQIDPKQLSTAHKDMIVRLIIKLEKLMSQLEPQIIINLGVNLIKSLQEDQDDKIKSTTIAKVDYQINGDSYVNNYYHYVYQGHEFDLRLYTILLMNEANSNLKAVFQFYAENPALAEALNIRKIIERSDTNNQPDFVKQLEKGEINEYLQKLSKNIDIVQFNSLIDYLLDKFPIEWLNNINKDSDLFNTLIPTGDENIRKSVFQAIIQASDEFIKSYLEIFTKHSSAQNVFDKLTPLMTNKSVTTTPSHDRFAILLVRIAGDSIAPESMEKLASSYPFIINHVSPMFFDSLLIGKNKNNVYTAREFKKFMKSIEPQIFVNILSTANPEYKLYEINILDLIKEFNRQDIINHLSQYPELALKLVLDEDSGLDDDIILLLSDGGFCIEIISQVLELANTGNTTLDKVDNMELYQQVLNSVCNVVKKSNHYLCNFMNHITNIELIKLILEKSELNTHQKLAPVWNKVVLSGRFDLVELFTPYDFNPEDLLNKINEGSYEEFNMSGLTQMNFEYLLLNVWGNLADIEKWQRFKSLLLKTNNHLNKWILNMSQECMIQYSSFITKAYCRTIYPYGYYRDYYLENPCMRDVKEFLEKDSLAVMTGQSKFIIFPKSFKKVFSEQEIKTKEEMDVILASTPNLISLNNEESKYDDEQEIEYTPLSLNNDTKIPNILMMDIQKCKAKQFPPIETMFGEFDKFVPTNEKLSQRQMELIQSCLTNPLSRTPSMTPQERKSLFCGDNAQIQLANYFNNIINLSNNDIMTIVSISFNEENENLSKIIFILAILLARLSSKVNLGGEDVSPAGPRLLAIKMLQIYLELKPGIDNELKQIIDRSILNLGPRTNSNILGGFCSHEISKSLASAFNSRNGRGKNFTNREPIFGLYIDCY